MQPSLRVSDGLRGLPGLGVLFAGLALAISGAALLGWTVGLPLLYNFGFKTYNCQPLTALGLALLAIAQLLCWFGRRRLALILILAPLAIGCVALAEYVSGVAFGTDRLLFPAVIGDAAARFPGRPGRLPATGLVALSVASWFAVSARRWVDYRILGLCALVMGLCCISIGLLLSGYAASVGGNPATLASSLPATIALLLLGSGALVHRAFAAPNGLFAPRSPSGRAIKIALPISVLLPAILLPLERMLVDHGFATAVSANIVTISVELALVVVLLSLGVRRIASGQSLLADSEARLEHAMEAHRVGLFDWQIADDRLRWSPGAEERLGVPPGTLTDYKSWLARVVPEDAERLMALRRDTAAQKLDRYAFRYRIRRADGDLRTIEGSSRCTYDRRGELVRLTGVHIDITDNARQVAEIARREAQWLAILRAVPDAMIVIDRDGVVKNFSVAAERMFGYSSAQVIGHSAMMLLPEGDARVVAAQLALGIVPGGAQVGADNVLTGQRQDGSQFPAEYRVGEAMIDDQPTFTLFIRDISDRRSAEQRFAALQLDYAHSARLNAVGELAAGLAHELNQPLAAGANYLGTAELLLEEAEGTEAAREMVQSASAQLLRAGEIIRRLRDFIAKTDADMRVEPLEELLREAVALALVGARQQQIEIAYDLDPAAQTIFADRIQIQQVVVNLVRNAAQALRTLPPDRRRITIATRALEEDCVEVSVADQGRGLPPEIVEQLFAPFRSTKSGEGLGIGLSICRRIIESHGGRLRAENMAVGGARISFTVARVVEEKDRGEQCVTSIS